MIFMPLVQPLVMRSKYLISNGLIQQIEVRNSSVTPIAERQLFLNRMGIYDGIT